MGVIEFHRVIRNYSLSYYDFSILDNDEIIFCQQMDNIVLIYYKLLRYANKYCKIYEKNALDLMKSMNIQIDDDNENDIDNNNNIQNDEIKENNEINDNQEENDDNEENNDNDQGIDDNNDENKNDLE